MTPDEIALVQRSFAKLAPDAEAVAADFYARLFETAPETRPLFKGDMAEQRKKLMATFGIVVSGLSSLESVLPAASALARKHVNYGVKAEHYPPVGAALLWTLEKRLGPDWSPELAAAWTTAWGLLSGFMINEAYGGRSAAAE